MLEVTISTTQIFLLYVSKYTQLQIRDQIPLMRGMKFAKKKYWGAVLTMHYLNLLHRIIQTNGKGSFA